MGPPSPRLAPHSRQPGGVSPDPGRVRAPPDSHREGEAQLRRRGQHESGMGALPRRAAETKEPHMAQVHHEAPTSGWVGMAMFGGVMMMVAGTFHAMAGLVGIFNDSYWLVPSSDLVITVDYTAWGWVHLIIGALAIAA